MRKFIFLMVIGTILAYEWLEFNDKYDCIVSITVDKEPVSVGVFITTRNVLTSANPLNGIGSNISRVSIQAVKGVYNESYAIKVDKIASNQSFRNKSWIPMGTVGVNHTCIHDIAIITIPESQKVKLFPKENKLRQQDTGRRPYPVKLPNDTSLDVPFSWVFAGFGYLDQEHVENNTILELSFSSESLADCDEWIPREWGRFICILDSQELYSLASGAPLFEDGDMTTVHGIGSFSLKKGKENLLVFTDLLPYVDKLVGYIEDKDPDNETKTYL